MASGNHETDTAVFHQKLEITKEQVRLVPQAGEFASKWLAYVTAQSEIQNFNRYTVKEVASNSKPIAEIMRSLRQTIPDSLNSNAVRARINVLYTKAGVLEQMAEKRNPHPKEIKATAEELPVDFNNLKIQINELFLKSLEDFEKELDVKEKKKDSTGVKTTFRKDSLPRVIN